MADIRFYHLQKQNLDQVLPLILEKSHQAGYRTHVHLNDDKEVERLNNLLWSYKPQSFLPHGSKKTGNSDKQPIFLSDTQENINEANVLVTTQGATPDNIKAYDMVCEMLDGRDEAAVKGARTRWKAYQEAEHEVTYWLQSDSGKWEKKA